MVGSIPGEPAVHEARALLSFMSESEAERYLSTHAYGRLDALKPLWRRARAAYRRLPPYDGAPPSRRPIDTAFDGVLDTLRRHPPFQRLLAPFGAEFALIEVDKLVAVQMHVCTDVAAFPFRTVAGDDTGALLSLCFPLEQAVPFRMELDNDAKVVNVYTLNRNLGVGDISVRPSPDGALQISIPLALGLNWLHVAEFDNRYFLKDGYHRVWHLRTEGVNFLPSVVTHAPAFADLGIGQGFFPEALLRSDQPPLVRYFFEDELAPLAQLRSTMTVLHVAAERLDIPRML